jgi:hypothetical protein
MNFLMDICISVKAYNLQQLLFIIIYTGAYFMHSVLCKSQSHIYEPQSYLASNTPWCYCCNMSHGFCRLDHAFSYDE